MLEYISSIAADIIDIGVAATEVVRESPQLALLALASFSALLIPLVCTVRNTDGFSAIKHQRNVVRSAAILRQIEKFVEDGKYQDAFHMLRFKIDPYLFEECILTAFEQAGAQVVRNKRYSGDGGVDGIVMFSGSRWLIQSKRYQNYISMKHVQNHHALCRQKKARGVFVHVGKTGRGAAGAAHDSDLVHILSGRQLLDFLAGYLPVEAALRSGVSHAR